MNTRKTLTLALLGAIVCVVSAEVGAAEVNVAFEGHFGGTTEAVAVSGNYAYIGQGEDLVVLDIGFTCGIWQSEHRRLCTRCHSLR